MPLAIDASAKIVVNLMNLILKFIKAEQNFYMTY